jgi:hypothetical protein
MPVAKKRPRVGRPVKASSLHLGDGDREAALRCGTGPYAVVCDYRTLSGNDPCSYVVRQCAGRAEAIKLAAGLAVRRRCHVRVEFWQGVGRCADRCCRSTVVREFGGPSAFLAAEALEMAAGGDRDRPGGRLSVGERDRRARAILGQLAVRPMATATVAHAIGHFDSGVFGVLSWGVRVGLWHRDIATGRKWEPTPAGLAWANGGPLP